MITPEEVLGQRERIVDRDTQNLEYTIDGYLRESNGKWPIHAAWIEFYPHDDVDGVVRRYTEAGWRCKITRNWLTKSRRLWIQPEV